MRLLIITPTHDTKPSSLSKQASNSFRHLQKAESIEMR
jgi:hypothetical protein